MRRTACALASLVVLTGCPEKAPPPPAEPATTSSAATAAASASASPADIAAATQAYETFKKRVDDVRGLLLPYRDNKKKAAPCAKRDQTEPALLIDNEHSFTTIRRHSETHWGRVSAQLEPLQFTGFLESDRKELRDWPFDPKKALKLLAELNATTTTIFIDVEETRPDVGDGDKYKPGSGKGLAFVVDSKKAVCVVPLEHTQSGTVKFESLEFEGGADDEAHNPLNKQASASVAVTYAYDYAFATQLEEKLKPLGWTQILMPRAPKK